MPKHILIIALLGLTVYLNSLNGNFIWDDEVIIKHNPAIENWAGVSKLFTQDIKGGGGEKTSFYRPFQLVTYMIDFSLWKLDPMGFHFTNMLLHILVALALYWLISILFQDAVLALLTSLFFISHPVHAAAVAYISGRADPLAALFMLISFILCIRTPHSGNRIFYPLMILSYALALLSKESSLILPALLFLYYYIFKEKVDSKNFLTISAMIIVYALFRVVVLGPSLPSGYELAGVIKRVPGFFVAVTNYARLIVFPFNLHMEYGDKLFYFTDPKAILGLVMLSLLFLYAFLKRNTDRLILFSTAWFFIALLAVSNLYPLNAYMAEHWLYLPSMGLFTILAHNLLLLYRRKEFRVFSIALIVGILPFWSYLAIRQNDYWRNTITFYTRTLKYEPDSARLYNNIGLAYYASGRNSEAIASYRKAIELAPRLASAYHNLGVVYAQTDKKIEMLEKAVELDPALTQAYKDLCAVYARLGRRADAVAVYKKAAGKPVNYADVYNKTALVYHEIDKDADAIGLLKRAIKIDPTYVEAYNNLGAIYGACGQKKEAIKLLQKAIEINPRYAKTYNNLAVAYFTNGQYELAAENYKKARKFGFINRPLSGMLKPYIK